MSINVTSTRRLSIFNALLQAMPHSSIDAYQLQRDFMESSRGKGKGRGGFVKSMAGKAGGNNFHKPHQGAKECARRRNRSW